MAAKYNRLLMTTGLSIITLSFTAPVMAGFEWTPPEKKEEVVVAPAPSPEPASPVSNAIEMDVDAAVIDVPAVEDGSPLEDLAPPSDAEQVEDVLIEDDAAPIEIRVLEEEVGTAEDAQSHVILTEEPPIMEEPVEVQVEAKVEDVQEPAEQEFEEPSETVNILSEEPEAQVEVKEEVIIEEPEPVVMQEDTAADDVSIENDQVFIEATEESLPKQEDEFTIDPFPEDMGAEQSQSDKAVFLSSDEELDEISSRDVIVEEPKTVKEEIIWNERPTFNIIEGFGSDMPLALVLTQIVPPQYAFSFGEGVNPGAIISWEGGEPWNIVLENALKPAGYSFSINGKKLSVKNDVEAVVANETPIAIADEAEENVAEEVVVEETAEEVEITIEPTEHEQAQETDAEPVLIVEDAPEAIEEEQPAEAEEAQVEEYDNPPLKRGVILDPGMEETEQPEADQLSDEKKNIESSNTLSPVTPDSENAIIAREEPVTIEVTDELPALSSETSNEVQDTLDNPSLSGHHPQELETTELTVIEIPALEEAQPLKENSNSKAEITVNEIPALDAVAEDEVIETQQQNEAIVESQEAETAPVALQVDESVDTSSNNAKPSNRNIVWEGKKGKALYDILAQWCEEENIALVWNLDNKDIELSSNIFINGTFKNAVDVLLSKGVKNAPQHQISLDPYQLTIY